MRPPEETRSLVERCLAGEPAAWEAFIHAYTPFLAAAVRDTLRRFQIRPEPARIQDLLQETFLSLIRSDGAALRAFHWECPLERYLASVAVHRTIDWMRRDGKFEKNDRAGDLALAAQLQADPAAAGSSPGELGEWLRGALERLDERERLALQLFYWESVPADRLARMLGIGKDSVWMLLTRARASLKALLKDSMLLL